MHVLRWLKQRPLAAAGVGLAVVALAIAIVLALGGSTSGTDLPLYPVTRGDFRITLTETGELRAKNSVVLSAPRVRSNLQIVWLAEKGLTVSEGDTLIIFDGAELTQQIDERVNELEITRANLEKSRSQMQSTLADLRANLESAEASYRIAELRLQQMQFEADVVKEEQQLSLKQSRISLEQARENIEQQKRQNEAELRTLELKVVQAEQDLEKARKDLEKLTITAPQPGLVVYKKIWKGSEMGEIKIGDQPWRGQALIELPDLSVMEVSTAVNEVDVARVAVDQQAVVFPDAFPDRRYHGHVVDVAKLARIDEEADAEVKVFDVVVELDSTDAVLKPGMTVSTTILIDEIPDTLYIPLDAVFRVEGEPVAYRRGGGFRRTPLGLGPRNANFVVVATGLEEGEMVSLVDPTRPFDPENWVGLEVEESGSMGLPGSGGNGGP